MWNNFLKSKIMEIKISTNQMLKILYVVSWILFVGVSVEAGSFIFNIIFTMAVNPINANHFGLAGLYEYDHGYFVVILSLMSIAAMLRATMFYSIVKILHDKKLDMSQPFNNEVKRFILNVSYLALGIGLFSNWGVNYTAWLVDKGVKMPDITSLRLGGADVWLFMGITLLVIAQIFKRGIEIQEENDLTI